MSNTAKYLLALGLVLVIVAAAWAISNRETFDTAQPPRTGTQTQNPPAGAAPTTTVQNPSAGAPKAGVKPVTQKVLSYEEMVEKYAGTRFQFSANCTQFTPSSFVLKTGSAFLIDNRDSASHVFTFDRQEFTLRPYGYAVLVAGTVGERPVLCDGVQRTFVRVER